ncbi:MAG: peptidoglycan DD-metalloendopeptidase family protein [Firmicutes bacterium]|nr:peptidoglycan DD-metalloendopeptidase family protein [Bacillota bacterium]
MGVTTAQLRSAKAASEARIRALTLENTRLKQLHEEQAKEIEKLAGKARSLEERFRKLDALGRDINAIIKQAGVTRVSRVASRGGEDIRIGRGLPGMTSDGGASGPAVGGGEPDASSPGENGFALEALGETLGALEEAFGREERELQALRHTAQVYQDLNDRKPSLWPVRGRISSSFGSRRHPITGTYHHHTGIDIATRTGTPVRATAAGTISYAGWQGGYGLVVIINHGGGVTTVYGHNSRLVVRGGQRVGKGQVIAYSGSTGTSTGPHVHYEVRLHGRPVDPRRYMR